MTKSLSARKATRKTDDPERWYAVEGWCERCGGVLVGTGTGDQVCPRCRIAVLEAELATMREQRDEWMRLKAEGDAAWTRLRSKSHSDISQAAKSGKRHLASLEKAFQGSRYMITRLATRAEKAEARLAEVEDEASVEMRVEEERRVHLEAEVERLRAWVCPFDMTLCSIHIHERGGRKSLSSGKASGKTDAETDREMLENEAAEVPFPSPSGVSPSPLVVDTHDHVLFFDDTSTGKRVDVHHSAICWCKAAAEPAAHECKCLVSLFGDPEPGDHHLSGCPARKERDG